MCKRLGHREGSVCVFLLNPSDSRANRFINVRMVRLFRSTCDVQMSNGSMSPLITRLSAPTISGAAYRPGMSTFLKSFIKIWP